MQHQEMIVTFHMKHFFFFKLWIVQHPYRNIISTSCLQFFSSQSIFAYILTISPFFRIPYAQPSQTPPYVFKKEPKVIVAWMRIIFIYASRFPSYLLSFVHFIFSSTHILAASPSYSVCLSFDLLISLLFSQVASGVYLCGDHRGTATLNGALESGRRAAKQALAEM